MQRDLLNNLMDWRNHPLRVPLILRGARQVGKSWLVNEFAKQFTTYIVINFDKEQAFEFLNKIQNTIEQNSKFLKNDDDKNNVFFKYDDIDVLICSSLKDYTIRLFWNGFDSSWEKTAFDRSKRRFEKKIK